jgi:hypothetical protein
MNDNLPVALREFVEEMLVAVPACAGRKSAMREELVAHLAGVFDDEFERLHDEDAAALETMRRFGDPADLGGDLRAAVSWVEWTCFHIFARKGNLMRWLFVILGVVGFFVGTGLIVPALSQMLNEGQLIALALTLFTVGSVITLSGVWSVVHGVRKFRVS